MNISQLPVSINRWQLSSAQTKQVSQLTPFFSTGKVSVSQSDDTTAQAKFSDTLVSSDRDYTKHDAMMKQWNKVGSFNLYEVMNGGNVNLQNPVPSQQELTELEQSLQQHGIGTVIDWSDLKFDFRGIGFSTNSPTWQLGDNDFRTKTEYFASRYAAMKVRIQETFSEDEQQAQWEQLDTICQAALEEIANGYADVIGDFCEQNGVAGEREKIYQAVFDGVNERIADYEERLSNKTIFSDLSNSEDAWLLQDDEYVAALLRKETAGVHAVSETRTNGYTWADLDALGRCVSLMNRWENAGNSLFTRDESEIALEFANLSITASEWSKNGTVSSAMSQTMQKLISGFMDGYMERTDDRLREEREAGLASKDQKGYAALDRQFILDVYRQTMERYHQTGDRKDALQFGMEYAWRQPVSQQRAGSYRYQESLYQRVR